jgi:hypothetical protein
VNGNHADTETEQSIMAIKRGPIEIKQGGRGTGAGTNPVIAVPNGMLPFDQQDKDTLSIADIITEQYGGNELALIEDCYIRFVRRDLPESEQLPTFWNIFWQKYPTKLLREATVNVKDAEKNRTAAENTANQRKSFASSCSQLAGISSKSVEEFAEMMIQSAS